jgi:D-sedoheptulose 7-phosphate isomerase
MVSASAFAAEYLDSLKSLLDRIPMESVEQVSHEIQRAFAGHRQIFIVGNGGSAATASHMVTDLSKGTLGQKTDATSRRPRVISLADNIALLTAWANDKDYSQIFSEQLWNLGMPGDLLIALSASGSSPNVVSAARTAREIGMRVVALTGSGGGHLAPLADATLVVPSHNPGPVEDVHMIFNHIVVGYLSALRRSQDQPASGALAQR